MSNIDTFLKSLQGVSADDLDPSVRAELATLLGDEPEPVAAAPTSSEGLLAKAVAGLTDLVKSMGGGKGKPSMDDDEEDDEDEEADDDEAAEKKDDEEDDRLEEAVKELAGELDDKEEKVKKSMAQENEVTVEELAKSLLDQYRAVHEAPQLEVVSDLTKAVQAQGEEIASLKKALAEQGSRPVPTLAPFELRKAIDTKAGEMGLPDREAAVSVMQKAFEHCTANQATVSSKSRVWPALWRAQGTWATVGP